jgi:hypothetical protein
MLVYKHGAALRVREIRVKPVATNLHCPSMHEHLFVLLNHISAVCILEDRHESAQLFRA